MTIAGKMLVGVAVIAALGFLALMIGGSGFGRWGAWSYYLFSAGVVLLIAAGVGTLVVLLVAALEAIVERPAADDDETRPTFTGITLLLAFLAVAVAGFGVYLASQL